MKSMINPKRPVDYAGWRRSSWWVCPAELARLGYPVEAWEHKQNALFVLSAVEVAREEGKPDIGPEYHLSVSAYGLRCSSADAVWVLGQFDLLDATEDNHVEGGMVRNFWRPVADRLSGYECQCVNEEQAIREDKGDFVYRAIG